MFKVSVKNLWSFRRRLVGTVVAIVLGVAFLSGSLVLGDTLESNFDNLFTQASRGTDAVIRSASDVDTGAGQPDAQRGLISEALAGTIRDVDGVAAVAPSIQGYGRILDANGDAIGGNGPPTFAGNWVDDQALNPYHLVAGRAPRTANEVVINKGAAERGDLHTGDTTTVQLPQPVQVRIVGIAKFGSADGLGGVTFVGFTLGAAQDLITKRPDAVTSILVRGEPGVSQTDLVHRVETRLPKGVEAITGSKLVDENTADIDATFLDFLRTFLLVFAGIALVVATFSIYNTFSIVMAQRTRESALLRAVGATGRQVLVAVVLEGLVIGLVASAIGLFAGVGIAGLLKGVFDAFGFALPAGGVVFNGSTAVTAMVVGVTVTLVASLVPAVKAARVAPLAALRDVAFDRTRVSRARVLLGAGLTVVGVVVVLAAALSGGDGALARTAAGALLTLVGIVVSGPLVAGPLCALLGAPIRRLRGVTGALARRNAMRNPRRTAGTAAALMVGVGLVTVFTVFAGSLKASIDDGLSETLRADVVVSSGGFGGGNGGFSPRLASDVGRLPQVRTALGLGRGAAAISGSSETLDVANVKRIDEVLDLDVESGSLARLGARSLGISDSAADDHGWHVGSRVPVKFSDGTTTELTVGAVYASNDLLGDYLLPRRAWDPHAVQDIDSRVLVQLRDGVSTADGKRAVERAAASYGKPDVLDRSEFIDQTASRVNIVLGIVYVLLALAILIALMGIANTLSLSIYERTRELGLLRAVGQTREQLRAMVRWESVLIALFGTVGGLGLGVFLGWGIVQAAAAAGGGAMETFAAPVGQLGVVLVVGGIAGVLAGLRPARRAARLDVLTAIGTE